MCTSLAMKTGDFYFGRNMDLEYEFGDCVLITPRNYVVKFRKAGMLCRHYAMIGMATVRDGYPLYAEAVNEKGLCIAGLNFPTSAYYPQEEDYDKANISPFELVLWLLGKCTNVDEAKKLLGQTHLISISFSAELPLSPLHWHIADKDSSFVLESTKDGIKIHDDPLGVLTNNPAFDFQMTNLSQYLNLTPDSPKNCFSENVKIKPFGQGLGSFGLPGDFSPASRFVKISYLKLNSRCGDDEQNSISQFFHLLDSVAMVRGSVITQEDLCDVTTYSCCVNVNKGVYYYKTYENSQLTAVDMNRENLNASILKGYPVIRMQQILRMN